MVERNSVTQASGGARARASAGPTASPGTDTRPRLHITVMISTYRRPDALRRCLAALGAQARPPNEVVVVFRRGDVDTESCLRGQEAGALPLRVIQVDQPGLIAALNVGLDALDTDIVAFTDDDSAPRPDWLARIEHHFLADLTLGGVGGRDWIPQARGARARRVVGLVQWWGRTIGNHHVGTGAPREVDILKGVNMAFRATAVRAVRFDPRLRGAGAQVHCEMDFCLRLRRAGWRLVYDPAVAVDHYLGPRLDYDQRDRFCARALREAVHNETYTLLKYLPAARRAVFLAWGFVIGTRAAPGLAQGARFLLSGDPAAAGRLRAGWAGRLDGWRTWRSVRRAGRPDSVGRLTPDSVGRLT